MAKTDYFEKLLKEFKGLFLDTVVSQTPASVIPELANPAGVEEITDPGQGTFSQSQLTQQDRAPFQPDGEAPPLPESEILIQFSSLVEQGAGDKLSQSYT